MMAGPNADHYLRNPDCIIAMQNVRILPTEAKTHQPVVYADWLHATSKPTLLIYGHYDVQPAEDVELWDHSPFQVQFKNG